MAHKGLRLTDFTDAFIISKLQLHLFYLIEVRGCTNSNKLIIIVLHMKYFSGQSSFSEHFFIQKAPQCLFNIPTVPHTDLQVNYHCCESLRIPGYFQYFCHFPGISDNCEAALNSSCSRNTITRVPAYPLVTERPTFRHQTQSYIKPPPPPPPHKPACCLLPGNKPWSPFDKSHWAAEKMLRWVNEDKRFNNELERMRINEKWKKKKRHATASLEVWREFNKESRGQTIRRWWSLERFDCQIRPNSLVTVRADSQPALMFARDVMTLLCAVTFRQ